MQPSVGVAPRLSVCLSVRPSHTYDFLEQESRRKFKFSGNKTLDKSN